MTHDDFARCMAILEAATGKPMNAPQAAVYFDLLGDLPAEALMLSVKRALLEHKYATFPPIAMLREFAVESMRGTVAPMTGQEAWGLALKTIGGIDLEWSEDHRAKALEPLTACPVVWAAVQAFGFMAIYNLPDSAIETARAQFIKTYEGIAERERMTGKLPLALQERLAEIKEGQPIAGRIGATMAAIGVEKP